jgi:hypothetical protein
MVTLKEKEELRDPKYSWRRFAFFNPSAPHQSRGRGSLHDAETKIYKSGDFGG